MEEDCEQAPKRMKLENNDETQNENVPSKQYEEEVCYGSLVVLGHANYIARGDVKDVESRGKRNEQFVLKKRTQANGIEELEERTLSMSSKIPTVPEKLHSMGSTHSLSICWAKDMRGFIEYAHDKDSDLFQFGRAPNNDFNLPGFSSRRGATMSRYAFRIQCQRKPPYACRIFAGGFDDSNQLFVGEGALTWSRPKRDAFVTNGVRVLFNTFAVDEEKEWSEVSCRGSSFSTRPDFGSRGSRLPDASNVLRNGTLISVGGVTLMWRSGTENNLNTTWNRRELQAELNKRRVQCPVQLSTIHFSLTENASKGQSQAWVYPHCGHVHGFNKELLRSGKCTMCRQTGVYTELKIEDNEISQIFSSDKPTHVFNPCGHAIDIKGARLWASIMQPSQTDTVACSPKYSMCPFCRTVLDSQKPFAKLIYQTEDEKS